jgi:hypothetical protein
MMQKDTGYTILFILVGIVSLILGLTWKKPTYGGGTVRKYGAIILGVTFLLYGIFSLF